MKYHVDCYNIIIFNKCGCATFVWMLDMKQKLKENKIG